MLRVSQSSVQRRKRTVVPFFLAIFSNCRSSRNWMKLQLSRGTNSRLSENVYELICVTEYESISRSVGTSEEGKCGGVGEGPHVLDHVLQFGVLPITHVINCNKPIFRCRHTNQSDSCGSDVNILKQCSLCMHVCMDEHRHTDTHIPREML